MATDAGGPRPYILFEANYRQLREHRPNVAVLPWGATEAHNYHLPYATDNIECDHVAAESARRAWEAGARVVVLPTVPFGVQTGQLDIPLCLNLNPSTQAAIPSPASVSATRSKKSIRTSASCSRNCLAAAAVK